MPVSLSSADADPADRTRAINFELLQPLFVWAFDGVLPEPFLNSSFLGWATAGWLIRSGGVKLRAGGRVTTARAGEWIFPASVEGWQEFQPGSSILSVRFSARWLDHSMLFDHTQPIVFNASNRPELETAGMELVRAVRTHVGDVHEALLSMPATLDAHFAIEERFQGWMAAYIRAMRAAGHKAHIMDESDERLLIALRHLENHPLSKPLREADVARSAGVSTSQLNRLFAARYNTTPKRRFDIRRQEFACNALRFTDAQVKSIAYKLGFSSLPHFTKWFHRRAGVTPTAYRYQGRR